MTKKAEILGLIPARGGSKGLPGKNVLSLEGTPLIAHSIKSALASQYLSRVIVATDSDEIAAVARDYGAETPFKRPAELTTDTSHAFEIYRYTVDWLEQNENYRPDIVCVMLCTTPFRTSADIDACMKKMLDTGCDWCFTVNEIEHHPYRAMTVEGDRMTPVFDVSRDLLWANRQELPKMVRFNGGVIAGRTEHIQSHDEYNIDKREYNDVDVRCVEIPQRRAIDIDTREDFAFVETLMKAGNG